METKDKKSISPLALILVIVGTVPMIVFIVLAVGISNQVRESITPLKEANSSLHTQVSQLLHPTPTIIPDPVTIIHEVQSLAKLETVQYSVEKVITAEVNQGVFGPLFGDKLLFIAHGYVIAGVDLGAIDEADLRLKDGKLTVNLPDAEVFVATLNNDDSYVYDRETGLLQSAKKDLETEARKAAEDEILRAALEDGILAQAQTNAEAYLRSLFNALGYSQVVFN